MNKCSCCGIESEKVNTYRLPDIGYGSVFDTFGYESITRFSLCPSCAVKINKWIKEKHPDIELKEFWQCNIIKMDQNMIPVKDDKDTYYEEFQYEDILEKVFIKFMPEVFYGEGWSDTFKGKLHKFIRRFFK